MAWLEVIASFSSSAREESETSSLRELAAVET